MRQVIYAWNYLQWGGAQIYTLSLIKLAIKHFDVVVVLPEGSDEQLLGFLKELRVRCVFFSPAADLSPAVSIRRKLQRRRNKIQSENAMLKTIEAVRSAESLIHVELAPQQSFFSLFRLAAKHVVFFTAHNSIPKHSHLRETIWKLKLRNLTKNKNFNLFTANRDTKRYLCEYISVNSCERITVTPAAIDPVEIQQVLSLPATKESLRAEFDLPVIKPTILSVGQFVDRKGPWVLLEAARKVLEQGADVQFVWMTSTSLTAETLDRIDSFGLGTCFRIINSSSVGARRQPILQFFRIADIFVLPSLTEGLPIAILEAMALGIPTISSRINAIPEAIIHDETGLLIEPGDVAGLSESIMSLVNNPGRRERLSRAGREFVLSNFDERRTAEIAVEAYERAFERKFGKQRIGLEPHSTVSNPG